MPTQQQGAFLTVDDYQQLPPATPDATFAYGTAPEQFIDLYLPTGGNQYPVIVLLHGGCWRLPYDAKPLGGLCKALVDEGWAVCNVEYRRAGNGGNWPNTFTDVAQAIDLLPQITDHYPLDLSHVITMGHSAGGTLALWLAARPRLQQASILYSANPQPVHAVIALAGIASLAQAARDGMCEDGLKVVMDGLPDSVPDHYRQVDPLTLLPIGMPHFHIVGDSDRDILANTQAFINAAQQAGDDTELFIAPQSAHFDVIIPNKPAWPLICDLLNRLK